MIPNDKISSYPFFAPNQVLSHTRLNQLFDYLEQQERLTRVYLIGIGIVCGLQIRYNPAESTVAIHISKGCGITSEGHLIIEPYDVDLVAYRPYTVPEDILEDYFHFEKPVVELVEEADDSAPRTSLNYALSSDPNFLSDKAVLLFMELKSEGLRNCVIDSCDDKGLEVKAKIRRLLVSLDDLKALSPASPATLPEIIVPRIKFSAPEDLHGYEQVYRDFFSGTPVRNVVSELTGAILKAFQLLIKIIPNVDNSGISQLQGLFNIPATKIVPIQYYYDFLRDLASAYNELRAALLPELNGCLPDSNLFPRHLTLGTIKKSDGQQYRTAFSPSQAITLTQQKIEEVQFLFDRLSQMILDFDIPFGSLPDVPTKITPSLFGSKYLSGKSMPFYYKTDLRSGWDPSRKGRPSTILTWHDDSSSADNVRYPLKYDLEPYKFFRVEGHIGKKVSDVRTELGNILKADPLPITLVYLNGDKVGDFLDKHPAVEHYAGVLSGGTFIIVHSGTSAVCDFSLPYRVEERLPDKRLCRTEVRECQYEWFDTKRHLVGITRHKYNAGLSKEFDKQILKDYYVVLVYKYEIQGQSLLTGKLPTQVLVPLSELASGHISAIARKLNEAFPDGLVFDYHPRTNKLIIRYFANQTFRIEWGGLQGNQIRYAYTQDEIFRWNNKIWESLKHISEYKVICRLRNEYRPEEYEQLHETDYYAGKYPAPILMPTAKELLRWEKMIKKRALEQEIPIKKTLLRAIKKAIDNAFNVGGLEVQATLIGSWVNGSWVSRDPSQNKFPSGFLSLRQKVTGKTGPSDINLMVSSESVTLEQISDVVTKIKAVKDSGYTINIFMGQEGSQKGIAL
jgi:hypothetical protein